ncbi:MAG: 4Fe-4S dicluster domain-containing protein, partial [Syntrophus sp. (in: bacteria)]
HKSGSGTYLEKEIELVGDDLDSFRLHDFDINRSPLTPYRDRGVMRFLSNRFIPRPVIKVEKCVACGMCVTICPSKPKSVDWVAGDRKRPPTHNYKTCIRCYCCQELCPESAIDIRYPLVRRIFGRGR